MATLVARDPRNIQRVALNHTDDVEASLRGAVLAKAYELFGYAADAFGSRGPLAEALTALGIAPLDQIAVDLYKKSKEKEWRVYRKTAAHWAVSILWPALLVGLSIAAQRIFNLREDPKNVCALDVMRFVAFFLCAVGLFFFNVGVAELVTNVHHKRDWKMWGLGSTTNGTPAWNRRGREESLFRYPRYVPVHLLNLAVSIKESLPTASFYVEELQHTSMDIPKPLPDPFLVVSLGSERYTIGVWDEREFEAKM